MNDYIGVHLLDLPHSISGLTVCVDAETYCVILNARMSHERQLQAYNHEIDHIDSRDFDSMYTVSDLEAIRHAD